MTSAARPAALGRVDLAIPEAWTTWSPHAGIAPLFSVDARGGRDGGACLRIAATGKPAYGAWRRTVPGIVPGRHYRLVAHLRGEGLSHPLQQAVARLRWVVADEGWLPDYLLPTGRDGEWTRLELTTTAPEGATAVTVDLALRLSDGGAARWDRVELSEVAEPARRIARLATVSHRPRNTASPAASVAEFARVLAALKPGEVDLVCLPEGITVVGTGLKYADVVEPIPGPTTAALGDIARRLRAYVCAGIYERAGGLMHNTSVLIGRDGSLVGTYRKTHLPQNEADGGLTPGEGYPVFQTDFGRVGMMVCWDNHFPEPTRRLAEAGAEVVCLPIWGGSDLLARARAIENHVHLVASSYDMKCVIVDPTGRVIDEATAQKPIAIAEVDLAARHREFWVGDFGTSGPTERRIDLG